METLQLKQKAKVGVAGSFINQMMSNNSSLPEVGKGATVLHYTDRSCYEVIEVSEDKKTAKLEVLEARWNKELGGGCGHQNWILEPTGRFCTVAWRNGSWKFKHNVIRFTKEFKKKHEDAHSYALLLTDEQRQAVYCGEVRPQAVVEGITEKAVEYSKVKILFGCKDYYYDWSF